MASLTIKADLPEAYDPILESPAGVVVIIPTSAAEAQDFGRNLLSGLAYARAQSQALRAVRAEEISERICKHIDQLIADAIEAERMMDAACQFIGRAIFTSNLETKGAVQ